MSQQPPSQGSRRCMIYKHDRHLPDECLGCGWSTTACAAHRDVQREPCCDVCQHDDETSLERGLREYGEGLARRRDDLINP